MLCESDRVHYVICHYARLLWLYTLHCFRLHGPIVNLRLHCVRWWRYINAPLLYITWVICGSCLDGDHEAFGRSQSSAFIRSLSPTARCLPGPQHLETQVYQGFWRQVTTELVGLSTNLQVFNCRHCFNSLMTMSCIGFPLTICTVFVVKLLMKIITLIAS